MLVGESAARTLPPSPDGLRPLQRRNAIVTMMALGSNVPDLDFLYSTISGSKLDYLLHHRGHTHTLAGAVLIMGLMLAACELWMRWRRLRPSRHDRQVFVATALLAPLLHIVMDYTNSYGVHPFWPFNSQWYYGDAMFIIEPLLWAAAAPLLLVLRTRLARSLVGLAMVGTIAVSIGSGLVPPSCVVLIVVAMGATLLARFRSARAAAWSGVAVWIGTTVVFMGMSSVAAARIGTLSAQQFPQQRLLDRVLTPLPANPLCWEVMLVHADATTFTLRRGTFTLAPAWFSAQQCPARSTSSITAPLQATSVPDTATFHWTGELVMMRQTLDALMRTNCTAAAFMKFARAPWLAEVASDAQPPMLRWVLGDLRFDREPGAGFAEFDMGATPSTCPRQLPPWREPRVDLLTPQLQ